MNLKENKIVNQNNIVTMIIIAINVVLYIITAIMSKNILDINAYVLLYMGGNYGALVSHILFYCIFFFIKYRFCKS